MLDRLTQPLNFPALVSEMRGWGDANNPSTTLRAREEQAPTPGGGDAS